jgi:hypothetical protein
VFVLLLLLLLSLLLLKAVPERHMVLLLLLLGVLLQQVCMPAGACMLGWGLRGLVVCRLKVGQGTSGCIGVSVLALSITPNGSADASTY